MYSWPVSEGGRPGKLLAASAAAYLLSRAPLLGLGFGADADVWTVAANSRLLLAGAYVPSRFPGHPLHELLFAWPMAAGGPLAANGLNLALSLVALWLTWTLARGWAVAAPLATVALVAVHPLFWIASADSTDFMLATTLALAALLGAQLGRPLLAGASLGLACATRIECLLFAVPLAFILRAGRIRAGLAAAGVAAAFLAPVALYYLRHPAPLNTGFLPSGRLMGWVAALASAVGLVPALALAALLVRARATALNTLRQRDPLAVAGALLVCAFVAFLFLHPGKSAYLTSAVPLALIALSRWTSGRGRMLLAAAFLSYGVVYPDVVDRDAGGVHAVLRANNGLLAKDVVARVNMQQVYAQVEARRPRSGVVVLAYWLDAWRWGEARAARADELAPGVPADPLSNAAWRAPDGTVLAHSLTPAELRGLRAQGVGIAYGEGADVLERETYGLDLPALGATPVPVRLLGAEVAERFTAPQMIACLGAAGPWAECLRARTGAR